MTKHPGSRRVHRAAADDDKFVTGVLETSVWARSHSRWLVIAGVAALLLIVGTLYVRNVSARKTEAAAQQLGLIRGTVQGGNLVLARQDLEKFVNTYGDTPSGQEGRIMLGQVQLQANEAQRAIQTLEPLADDLESPLGYSAALLLAAAYEANKQLDESDRVYLRIAENGRFDFQKREALDRAARLRVDRGNTAGAAELYERILATFEDDDPKEVDMQLKTGFEMRLAELRAQTARS